MLEVLQFIFRDFWTWLGTLFLLLAIFKGPPIVINNRKNKD